MPLKPSRCGSEGILLPAVPQRVLISNFAMRASRFSPLVLVPPLLRASTSERIGHDPWVSKRNSCGQEPIPLPDVITFDSAYKAAYATARVLKVPGNAHFEDLEDVIGVDSC